MRPFKVVADKEKVYVELQFPKTKDRTFRVRLSVKDAGVLSSILDEAVGFAGSTPKTKEWDITQYYDVVED